MGLADKLAALEEELARTQKNKATEFHIGILKSKIAKLRKELSSPKKSKSSGSGFAIKKEQDATIALVGLPSTGKSTILNALTGAKSKTASYAFTTLSCIPGVFEYKGAKIQVLDLPGIVEGASRGTGRGKEVIAAAKASDLIVLVLDVFDPFYRDKLIYELYEAGIRLDKNPPKISIEKKSSGGIKIVSFQKQDISNELIIGILKEYSIHNANIILQQKISVDDLIDFLAGGRVYIPSLTVINKIDLGTDKLKDVNYEYVPLSAQTSQGLDELKEKIFQKLNLIRVYTKSKFNKVDDVPLMIKKGSSVAEVCKKLHRDLLKLFKYALVWGKSVKFPGQRVGLDHILQDGDIVQIIKK